MRLLVLSCYLAKGSCPRIASVRGLLLEWWEDDLGFTGNEKVKAKASPISGEGRPRFLISSLDSN